MSALGVTITRIAEEMRAVSGRAAPVSCFLGAMPGL